MTQFLNLPTYIFKESKKDKFFEEYDAHRLEDGTYEVRGMPVFSETEKLHRQEDGSTRLLVFDGEWLEKATKTGNEKANGRFYSPAHVEHHDKEGKVTRKLAGYMTNYRKKKFKVEGNPCDTIFVDVTRIPPEVFEEMAAGRLGFRSVEIGDPDKPMISSLAFMAASQPHFKYPVSRAKLKNDSENDKKQHFEAERIFFSESDEPGVHFLWYAPMHFKAPTMADKKPPKSEKADKSAPPDDSEDDVVDTKDDMTMPGGGGAPPAPMPPPPGPDPMAAMGGGGVDIEQAVERALLKILPSMLQSSGAGVGAGGMGMGMGMPPQKPPAPPAPVAANADSNKTVQFKDSTKMEFKDPAVAAKFAELEAEVARLKQSNAQADRNTKIRDGVQFLENYRVSKPAAGGGTLNLRLDPQTIKFYADQANSVKFEELDKYFRESVPAVARMVVVDITEPKSDPAKEADPAVSAVEFCEKSEFLKERVNGKDSEVYTAAVNAFRDTWNKMPPARKENYRDEVHFVESSVRTSERITLTAKPGVQI